MTDAPDAVVLQELGEAAGDEARRTILAREGVSLHAILAEAGRRCALLDRRDHDAALRLAALAVRACPPDLDRWGHGRALRMQANCLLQDQPAAALALLERAETLFLEEADDVEAAHARLGQVGALNELGRQQEALARAQTARRVFRQHGLDGPLGKLLANEGLLTLRLGRPARALRLFERSRALLRRTGDAVAMLQVDRERAAVLEELGRVGQARRLYGRAIRGYRQVGLRTALAETEANLGALACAVGSPAEALRLLLSARATFQEEGNLYALGLVQCDLAESYRRLNLHAEALEHAETALQLLSDPDLRYDRARSQYILARVAAASEEGARARSSLAAAISLFEEAGAPLEALDCGLVGAGIARGVEEQRVALADLARIEDAFLAAACPARQTATRLLRARLVAAIGERAQARAHLEVAERQARALGVATLLADCLQQRGALERDEDPVLARRCLLEALALAERARRDLHGDDLRVAYLHDKLGLYEDLTVLYLREASEEGLLSAFNLVEHAKSRTLLDRVLGDPAVRRQIADPGLRRRLGALREEIAWLQLQLGRSGVERGTAGAGALLERLRAREERYEGLVREAQAARPPGPARVPEAAIRAEELQAALGPNSALVEYFAVDGRYRVFVLDRRGLRVCELAAGTETVRAAAERLAFHLEKFRYPQPYLERSMVRLQAAARHYLEELYVELAAPWYESVDAAHLVIVPHGPLHGLPFHAFHDGISYLLEDRLISYAPSGGVLRQCLGRDRRHKQAGRPLLVGMPGDEIPHIEDELRLLAAVLPGACVLAGAQATRMRVCRAMRGSSLIHLASHGVFRPENPLFSGIWLADGWLTGQDLYTTRLQADLVTLSACETGVQRAHAGDDLFGLVRAFLHAGSGAVIASMWPVHDRATSTLMATMYEEMAAGRAHGEALRAAQLAGLEAGQHPYYWAPFMLVGDFR